MTLFIVYPIYKYVSEKTRAEPRRFSSMLSSPHFYRLDFGFNASLIPSPIKLIDKMVKVIAKAGGNHIHIFEDKTSGSRA